MYFIQTVVPISILLFQIDINILEIIIIIFNIKEY